MAIMFRAPPARPGATVADRAGGRPGAGGGVASRPAGVAVDSPEIARGGGAKHPAAGRVEGRAMAWLGAEAKTAAGGEAKTSAGGEAKTPIGGRAKAGAGAGAGATAPARAGHRQGIDRGAARA